MEQIDFASVRGTPYEMGRQRGQQLARKIQRKIERNLTQWHALWSKALVESLSRRFERALSVRAPEILEELRGISDGASIPYEEFRSGVLGKPPTGIMEPSLRAQVSHGNDECSCLVYSADQRLFMTKNDDLAYDCPEDDLTVIEATPNVGHSYIAATWFPEWPGGTDGINDKGLAMLGSGVMIRDALPAYNASSDVGVPIHLLESIIWANAGNVEEALTYVRKEPRGFLGRNLLIAESGGRFARCEVSFNHSAATIYESGSYVFAAGHFDTPCMKEVGPSPHEYLSSYTRVERYRQILATNADPVDLESLKRMMSDHENGPSESSICRHSKAINTLGGVIIEVRNGRMHVLKGRPCEQEFAVFTITRAP